MTDYEKWRPALAAFYRAEGYFQSAENVDRGYLLDNSDRRTIDALIQAAGLAPERKAA